MYLDPAWRPRTRVRSPMRLMRYFSCERVYGCCLTVQAFSCGRQRERSDHPPVSCDAELAGSRGWSRATRAQIPTQDETVLCVVDLSNSLESTRHENACRVDVVEPRVGTNQLCAGTERELHESCSRFRCVPAPPMLRLNAVGNLNRSVRIRRALVPTAPHDLTRHGVDHLKPVRPRAGLSLPHPREPLRRHRRAVSVTRHFDPRQERLGRQEAQLESLSGNYECHRRW